MLFHMCASAECRELRPSLAYVRTCFESDKNTVWIHCNASASDFTSVVVMVKKPLADSDFTILFCYEHFMLPTPSLNWIWTNK